jgi:sterol desaturase/sphingolipid hydroxylase (fatty acid hydroxylase superfamily)
MSYLAGALFPFVNLWKIAQLRGKRKKKKGAAAAAGDGVIRNVQGSFSGGRLQPYSTSVKDYVGAQAGSLPKILLTTLLFAWTVDLTTTTGAGAPAGYFASPGSWAPATWVLQVVLRDLSLMLVVPGGWDYLLYFSRFKEAMRPYKFNSKYPDRKQFVRDVTWTTSATLLASLQEILLWRWWASGQFKSALFGEAPVGETHVPCDTPFFAESAEGATFVLTVPLLGLSIGLHEFTLGFILWTATMYYWRIFHFWFIHRNMHPWWDRKNGLLDGDVGAFLYRWVHSHHHRSYNPTAFSGMSMLPLESIGYMSAALIPLLFRSGCHPWIHLYTKVDLIIGAQIGHDGFDAPGGGSYYHQLHHAHFECNYGDAAVPMDYLLGTFEDGTRWNKEHRTAIRDKIARGNMAPAGESKLRRGRAQSPRARR